MRHLAREPKPTIPLRVMSFFAADVQEGRGPFLGTCDTRRDELTKLGDVDSSTLLP
jgi:hypothetical protein